LAVDTVPGQSPATFAQRSGRFIVRAALALLAMWTLRFAQDRNLTFVEDFSAHFGINWSLWLEFLGASAGAGVLFGLAAMFPFSRVRYHWSRLLLAALISVPLFQYWFIQGYLFQIRHDHSVSGWVITSSRWFGSLEMQLVLAVLVGIAVASGFQPREREPGPSGE
jgi:hypothetical protein